MAYFFIPSVALSVKSIDKIDSLNNKAIEYLRTDPDSSLILANKALDLGLRDENDQLIAQAYSIIARVYMLKREDNEAYSYFMQALTILQKSSVNSHMSTYVIYRNMAALANRNRSYLYSIEYYDSAYSELEKAGLKSSTKSKDVLEAMNNVKYYKAIALKKSGFYAEAGEILTDLWSVAEGTRNNSLYVKVAHQIGLVEWYIGEFEKSRKYQRRVLNYVDDPHLKGRAYHNIASTYISEGLLDSAKENLDRAIDLRYKSIELSDKASRRKSLFISLLDLGEVYYRKSEYQKAIEVWNKALDLRVKIDSEPSHYIIHNWLDRAYKYSDIELSEYHSSIYKRLNDNFISSRDSIEAKMSAARFDWHIENFEKSRAFEAQRKLDRVRSNNQLILALFITCTFVLVLLFLIRKYRHHVFHKQMQELATKKPQ